MLYLPVNKDLTPVGSRPGEKPVKLGEITKLNGYTAVYPKLRTAFLANTEADAQILRVAIPATQNIRVGTGVGYGQSVKSVHALSVCPPIIITGSVGIHHHRIVNPKIPPFYSNKIGVIEAVRLLRVFSYRLRRWLPRTARRHMPKEVTYKALTFLFENMLYDTVAEEYSESIRQYAKSAYEKLYIMVSAGFKRQLYVDHFVYAYLGHIFKRVERWNKVPDWYYPTYPFQEAVDLWNAGYVAGTRGKRWCLYHDKTSLPIWEGHL